MTFRKRLFLGFGAIFFLIIALMSIVITRINILKLNMNIVINNQYQLVQQANTIGDSINKSSRSLRDLLLDPEIKKQDEYIDKINTNTARAFTALENLTVKTNDDKARETVSNIKLLTESYRETCGIIITMVQMGDRRNAVHRVYKDATPTCLQLVNIIDELIKLEEEKMHRVLQQSSDTYRETLLFLFISVSVAIFLGILITYWTITNITKTLGRVSKAINDVASRPAGNLPRLEINSDDEMGQISAAFNDMAAALDRHYENEQQYNQVLEQQNWLKSKIAEISIMYQGIQDVENFASSLISRLTPMISATYGVFYLRTDDNPGFLKKIAAYAGDGTEPGAHGFKLGEGLIGQCGIENKAIILNEVPENYFKISSGLGNSLPKYVVILPVNFEGKVEAVLEFASLHPVTNFMEELLDEVLGSIGIVLNRIKNHMKVEHLLKEAQALTEELQVQTEELQTQQEELNTQQEELQATNEKLEEQYKHIEQKNKELEIAKGDLETKSRELSKSSKYKSEFLANMSHELRTPLNGILVLSEMLSENSEGNLAKEQIEFSQMINTCGLDLLNLINDILDLSKIESGKIDTNPSIISLTDLSVSLKKQFIPLAQQKDLQFEIILAPHLADTLFTDEQKLTQILKNLLSNAFKFTEKGSVKVHIFKTNRIISGAKGTSFVGISVSDTGIGIPKNKQDLVFEAFLQADGTTSRKFGGTGLGLSISKELSALLGGTLVVESTEGKGSVFTLYLPSITQEDSQFLTSLTEAEAASSVQIEPYEKINSCIENGANPVLDTNIDNKILKGKKILIVDDDMRNLFALSSALERYSMNVLCAENGLRGVEMLTENRNIDLVLMDIMMPVMNGYEAIRNIRADAEFRELPIIALTAKAMKGDREKCLDAGASDYISKPVNLEQLLSLIRVWLYK